MGPSQKTSRPQLEASRWCHGQGQKWGLPPLTQHRGDLADHGGQLLGAQPKDMLFPKTEEPFSLPGDPGRKEGDAASPPSFLTATGSPSKFETPRGGSPTRSQGAPCARRPGPCPPRLDGVCGEMDVSGLLAL